MNQTPSNINRRMAKGALWMVGLRFADQSVGFISTIILARLLVPADFGLVALSMAIVAAMGVFGEFGFDLALIQNQKADRTYYDTAWTLGILRGLIAGGLVFLCSGPIAGAYGDLRLADLLSFLAILPVLQGFINIGIVNFRKELVLGREFAFRFSARVAGTVTTITLAFLWRDYWALVAGTLTASGIRLVTSYMMQNYRPRLSLAAWRDIMSFSKWILFTSIFAFINRKSDTFIIGKFLDLATLGVFSIAAQISKLASSQLTAPIKRALFPGYAKLAHDTALLRQSFIDAYGILVLIAAPVAVGVGMTADLFIPIVLGPKWIDAVPLIQILTFGGILMSIRGHVRPAYLALNRPKLGAYVSIAKSLVLLPFLFIGLWQLGIVGAAWAHVATQVVMSIIDYAIVRRLLGVKAGNLLMACWRSLVACTLIVFVVSLIKQSADDADTEIILLITCVAAGAFSYSATVIFLWYLSGRPADCPEAYMLEFFLKRRRKPRVA